MKNTKISVLKNNLYICIKNLLKYNDLGFILNHMDGVVTLHIPCKKEETSVEEYNLNKNISLQALQTALDTFEKLSEELNLRQSTFTSIREIYPNFCTNIKDNLSPEQHQEYINLLKKVSDVLSHIIFDKENNKSNSENILFDKLDVIGKLVDSQDTSKLGNIEDTFVLKEIESLDIAIFDEKTKSNIKKIKEILISRTQKYEEYKKLYDAKTIKFKLSEGRDF